MQMKLTHYIYISAALTMLTACGDDIDPVYTVGEADNAIVLQAGIVEGIQARTRASENLHVPFSSTTQLRLHIEGEWTGKEPALQQYNATCSTKTASSKLDGADNDPNDVHPLTELTSMIYWDNYGTADPANATNREIGLTVLGVAVDKETAAPTVADDKWKGGFEWSVATEGTGVLKKDLLITNNFKSGKDGSTVTGFAFDTRDTKNLLEFKHVLSKITINLTAGLGFPSTAPTGKTYVGKTTNKFETEPIFTLTSNKEGESNAEYALTAGTINISTGSVTETASSNKAVIAETTEYPEGTDNKVTVRKEALVFPGTLFADNAVIGKLVADKNVYYITAGKIRAAILEKEGGSPDYKTKSGYNYILNITVNKTSVSLSATVAKWIDVDTAEDTPKINITTSYGDPISGDPSNAFGKNFSLYVSEKKNYVSSPTEYYYGEAPNSSGYYAENRWYNQSGETGKKLYVGADTQAPLYWPNHETCYFFRGVWPRTKTDGNTPAVTKDETSGVEHQVIAASNAKYETSDAGSFPSDLMIGIPTTKASDGSLIYDNNGNGISATEGTITLNFTYRMAQVEVHLVSSGYDSGENAKSNNIDFGEKTANQATVKILNGYSDGYILLSDGSAIGKTYADYQMNPKSTTKPTSIVSYTDNFYYRHDAVIPQNLVGKDSKPLQFQITTGSDADKYDKYYINIKDINVTSINGVDQPEGTKITKWEAGKHYIYTLKVTKTEVKIEATITDWKPVYAGGDFWL